jgi:hypothetical protein
MTTEVLVTAEFDRRYGTHVPKAEKLFAAYLKESGQSA